MRTFRTLLGALVLAALAVLRTLALPSASGCCCPGEMNGACRLADDAGALQRCSPDDLAVSLDAPRILPAGPIAPAALADAGPAPAPALPRASDLSPSPSEPPPRA